MTVCDRLEEVRDYSFGELASEGRQSLEQHLTTCPECSTELDRLRLTTAALRIVPDQEIPQRIAFVSDKVFRPSPISAWFTGFWNSAARLGFASACVLAAALIFFAWHASPGTRSISQTATLSASAQQAEIAQQVNAAVAQVREEDAKMTQAALAAADRKHEQEHRALMIAVEENMTILQKRLSTYNMLASNQTMQPGSNQ